MGYVHMRFGLYKFSFVHTQNLYLFFSNMKIESMPSEAFRKRVRGWETTKVSNESKCSLVLIYRTRVL